MSDHGSSRSCRLTYDPHHKVAYVEGKGGRKLDPLKTREVEPDLIVDRSSDGRIVGVEVLDPRRVTVSRLIDLLENKPGTDHRATTHTTACAGCCKRAELVQTPHWSGKWTKISYPEGWFEIVDEYGLHVVCSEECVEALQEPIQDEGND